VKYLLSPQEKWRRALLTFLLFAFQKTKRQAAPRDIILDIFLPESGLAKLDKLFTSSSYRLLL
jgi:hypothetical protein